MIVKCKIKGASLLPFAHPALRTDYVRLHFDSHESAWIAAAKLEVMLAEMSTPFFSFDWIKTSWYYESANKEKQRKRLSTLIDDDKNSKTQIDDPLIDDVEQLKL